MGIDNIKMWYNISLALDWYSEHNYELIETPWTVSGDIINITFDKEFEKFKLESLDEYLVGSAEQGFINLLLNNYEFDKNKKYMSISPCFRTESIIDEIHLPYFIKIELFKLYDENEYNLLNDSLHCFKYLADYYISSSKLKFETIKTEDGFDIILNDIEIGSYGIRKYQNFIWEYGTGLAEPRFFNTLYRNNSQTF